MSTSSSIAKQLNIALPSPLELLDQDFFAGRFWIKRDDLIHPIISGNKWRKLAGWFNQMEQAPIEHIVSFGGGYSNHLHALGYICHQLGIRFTAIIRGQYQRHPTPCILDLIQWHTDIVYTTKLDYKAYTDSEHSQHQQALAQLKQQYPHAHLIPEGGATQTALLGCQHLAQEIQSQLASALPNNGINTPAKGLAINCKPQRPAKVLLVLPVATATTMAGLVSQTHPLCHVLGIAVLKGPDYLENNIQSLLSPRVHALHAFWSINHHFHGGGYAKHTPTLLALMDRWQKTYNIELEGVYSGKVAQAMEVLSPEVVKAGYTDIVFIHTGGLQGKR